MSFQEKIRQRVLEKNTNENDLPESDGRVEPFARSEFFGVENISNSTACLDLRLSDGNFKAFPYSYIQEINFNVSDGIEILSATKKILIIGRNLKLLYNYLTAFRVKYVQANVGNDLTEETSLFVKQIVIEAL
jgi:hypothetical protein